MPYSIEWKVKDRLILETAFGVITVEELVRFNEEVTKMIIEEGTSPVHIIADLTKVERYPPLRDILSAMRKTAPDKVGWMVVVTENPIMRFLASMIFQIARLRLRMYPTMQQAMAFLTDVDVTLTARKGESTETL